MRHIALLGKRGSGKDTAARRLIRAHGYTRVAFADPLKDMALRADPVIGTRTVESWDIVYDEWEDRSYAEELHLSAAVADIGWECAKSEYPEVRRYLQHSGQAIRELDPRFWIRLALDKIADTDGPVVVTDVRYLNEVIALQNRGFTMVRVVRPDLPTDANSSHDSETELDSYTPRYTLDNSGTLPALHAQVDKLVNA